MATNYFWIGFAVFATLITGSLAALTEKLDEKNQEATAGGSVRLHCKPRNGQPVRWYYQQSWGASGSEMYFNEQLVNGYSKSCQIDKSKTGEWNLVIKTVTVENSGIYSCIEDNGLGDYYLIHLKVIAKDRESVVGKHQNTTVGSTVVLHCRPSNGQRVRWYYLPALGAEGSEIYFNGNFINGFSRSCEMDTSVDGEWNLVIKTATAENTGIYSCTENDGQGDHHVIQLNVLQPDVVMYSLSSSTTTKNTNDAQSVVPDMSDIESKMNDVPSAVVAVAVCFSIVVLAAVVALTVICVIRRRRLSTNAYRKNHAQVGGDEIEELVPKLNKGTPESWRRVVRLKDKLLMPTKATLNRWTSDKFVFEVIQDAECYGSCVDKLEDQIKLWNVDVIFGINVNDSRGEIFGIPLARRLGIKYEPIWPAVLMPEGEVLTMSFDTRFGKEIVIGIRKDACRPGDKVVIIDSYVRTGRIKKAATELIEGKLQAKVIANIVFAAVNTTLPDRPLYSVFQPYFHPYIGTKAGLFKCVSADSIISGQSNTEPGEV